MQIATSNPGPVDRARFERDGYLVLPDWIAPAVTHALQARVQAILQAADPDRRAVFSGEKQPEGLGQAFLDSADSVEVFYDPGAAGAPQERARVNKIGHALHRHDPVFASFAQGAPALARALGFDDARVIQSTVVIKGAAHGAEVGAHTDQTFLFTRPFGLLGLWYAFDDANCDNGCLEVLPGGHLAPIRRQWVRRGDQTHFEVYDPRPYADDRFVPLEVARGAVIALHGRLPHRSGANRSSRPRNALTFHLAGNGAQLSPRCWLREPSD